MVQSLDLVEYEIELRIREEFVGWPSTRDSVVILFRGRFIDITHPGLLLGRSFMLIRIAVEHITPVAVVFARMFLGAIFLLPIALRVRGFNGMRKHIPAVVAITIFDMLLPTFLTAWGEQRISSSSAGILTATDPLFVALMAFWLMPSEAVTKWRLVGLVAGFLGVATLLGVDLRGTASQLLGAAAVLVSALVYAGSTLIYRRWLAEPSAVGVTALMLLLSSVATAVPGIGSLVRHPPTVRVTIAVLVLGIVNTGIAYWLYYTLVDQAGAASASVITYVMPVVALILGVSFLNEELTAGALAGLALIGAGSWLATRQPGEEAGKEEGKQTGHVDP